MIFDHRTYTCKVGTLAKQLELYERHGLQVQVRHLGEPALYGFTETGSLNSYVHVWTYDSAADRERRRAAMAADPEWQAYLTVSHEAGYLIGQKNKILTAPKFFKPKR